MIHNYFIIKILWQIATAISHPGWNVQEKGDGNLQTHMVLHEPRWKKKTTTKTFQGGYWTGESKSSWVVGFLKSNLA